MPPTEDTVCAAGVACCLPLDGEGVMPGVRSAAMARARDASPTPPTRGVAPPMRDVKIRGGATAEAPRVPGFARSLSCEDGSSRLTIFVSPASAIVARELTETDEELRLGRRRPGVMKVPLIRQAVSAATGRSRVSAMVTDPSAGVPGMGVRATVRDAGVGAAGVRVSSFETGAPSCGVGGCCSEVIEGRER